MLYQIKRESRFARKLLCEATQACCAARRLCTNAPAFPPGLPRTAHCPNSLNISQGNLQPALTAAPAPCKPYHQKWSLTQMECTRAVSHVYATSSGLVRPQRVSLTQVVRAPVALAPRRAAVRPLAVASLTTPDAGQSPSAATTYNDPSPVIDVSSRTAPGAAQARGRIPLRWPPPPRL